MITPGEVCISTSKATVDNVVKGNEFAAGDQTITFSIQAYDKYNNPVKQNLDNKFKLYYQVISKDKPVTYQYSGISGRYLKDDKVMFPLKFTEAGEYNLYATYDSKKLNC